MTELQEQLDEAEKEFQQSFLDIVRHRFNNPNNRYNRSHRQKSNIAMHGSRTPNTSNNILINNFT